MKSILLTLVLVVIPTLLASCGAPASTPPPSPTPTPPTQAPEGASELYSANCAACHGTKREGISNLGPALTPQRLTARSEAELKQIILNGQAGTAMPPWRDRLTESQIDSLVQFIKTVQPQ